MAIHTYTHCSFTMDKSESIMIRTRQKWRRHQQAHRRHLLPRACPRLPPPLPPRSLLACSPVHSIVCPKPTNLPLPRGNRGEARRTFRLITILQFNEKPVSVLSVHNGRRSGRSLHGGLRSRCAVEYVRGVARPQRRGLLVQTC